MTYPSKCLVKTQKNLLIPKISLTLFFLVLFLFVQQQVLALLVLFTISGTSSIGSEIDTF